MSKWNKKEMMRVLNKISKDFGKMKCGENYCYNNEHDKCPIYRECRLMDMIIITMKEKLEEAKIK